MFDTIFHGALLWRLDTDVIQCKYMKATYRIAKFYYHLRDWYNGILYVGLVFDHDRESRKAQDLQEDCLQMAARTKDLELLPEKAFDGSMETCRACRELLAGTRTCKLECGNIYCTT
jgi:hypothetical protein